MKVFLSWSGEHSKQIASVFKDWLPSVIQSIDPFISSEDIEKGSRWNSDIAQKLQDTSFGIIFLTKDNLNAPWLNFEAGALSKALNNSYVAPFLYDIKPSDLTGFPISQFQTTSFTKEDVNKLIITLNNASGTDSLIDPERLDKAFSLWYPKLEEELGKVTKDQTESTEVAKKQVRTKQTDFAILEDILESSRNTQRMLGNTDMKLYKNIERLQEQFEMMRNIADRDTPIMLRRESKRINVMLIEDFLRKDDKLLFPYKFLFILGFFRDDYPWIYDAGKEFLELIKSYSSKQLAIRAQESFLNIIELSGHPIMMEIGRNYQIAIENFRALSMLLANYTKEGIEQFLIAPESSQGSNIYRKARS